MGWSGTPCRATGGGQHGDCLIYPFAARIPVVICAAVAVLTIRLLEHAGLSVIVLGALEGKRSGSNCPAVDPASIVATGVDRNAHYRLRLARRCTGIDGSELFAGRLLPAHDINFYLRGAAGIHDRPLVIGVVAIATLAVGAWLFVRWRLVGVPVRWARLGAFEAAILSRGVVAAGLAMPGSIGSWAGAASAAAGLGQVVVRQVLDTGRMGTFSLAVSFGLLLLLRTVVGAAIISIGAGIDAVVFTAYYRKRRQIVSGEPTLPFSIPDAMTERTAPGARRVQVMALVVIVIGLCESEMIGLFVMMDALKHERPIAVTAHRGGHLHAPENTVASIREAIADGAQYAEIDVQMTKDRVLVVTHDSDFSRMAGVPKKVWDLTYSEIRSIPLGAHSAPEFRNEPAPTFDELLAAARDQIKLNVELKYYGDHQPHLAERVVAAVKRQGMTNQVIIQSLKYKPLQEVHRPAPKIPVG